MRSTKLDELIAGNLRIFVSMVLGFLLFAVGIGVALFLVALRPDARVMVPVVQGMDLVQGIIQLQERELNARIQLRVSASLHDRGMILEQDPAPGTIVAAGRLIHLTVSHGAVVNVIEDFVGRDLAGVRADLAAFHIGGAALTIRDPVMMDYSQEPAGTILRQSPVPGTDVTGPTELAFVVSQGPQQALMTVPALAGLSVPQALSLISADGLVFEFSVRDAADGEPGETVVHQSPPAGANATANTRIGLTVTAPHSLLENEVFSLFSHDMPQNPFPLPVTLDAVLPSGERRHLVTVDFPGGRFTAPYRLPMHSILVLSMMGREVHREIVWGL